MTKHRRTIGKQRKRTTEVLAEALSRANAPQEMIAHARSGYYDDFLSDLVSPIHQLVEDAEKHGLTEIAQQARDGKYDAQGWEADAWMQSEEGQKMLRALAPQAPTGVPIGIKGHPMPHLALRHPATLYEQRQPGSTHVLVCPVCEQRRYVDKRFVESLEATQAAIPGIEALLPRHRPCNAIMQIHLLD